MRRLLLAFVLISCSAPLAAQAPSTDWRTIETAHYRFHYPAPFEEWTLGAVTRMEAIRSTLVEEIGYAPPERVDVIVADPLATANGSAWPFIGWPRMVLWTNAPGPASSIGANRGWAEMLTIHEQAHLTHILRPSRNPARRLLESLLPLGPIAFAPRWISEGYATLLEGELTGSGRPNSSFRAAVIRQWARQGRMPSYAQLNSDRANWMGMSMAYLVGSSYLEWLRERAGDDSLEHLWRRMTARSGRSFDDAFAGVFGDSPRALYARYVAEVTAKAIELEAAVGTPQQGELWQDLSWTTEAPDVSPDGELLVTVIRGREKPPKIVVFSTAPDVESEKKFEERIAKMLERDPEDVAPVRAKPLPRKPKYALPATRDADPSLPRWMPDGKRLLFGRNEMDGDGVLHPDLFIWTPESGEVQRITRLADVREADPSPDGTSAVAVRNRYGKSQLVLVDLRSGDVRDLTPASTRTVYATPRWGGDGIVFVRQFRGEWELATLNLDTREVRNPWQGLDGTIAHPAVGGGRIFVSVARGGFIEIAELGWDFPAGIPLTRTAGASFAPAPSPDGKFLYYLSLDADGFDIRRLSIQPRTPAFPDPVSSTFAPVVPPPPADRAPSFEEVRGQTSRPYGIGRQEFAWILSGNEAPSNRNVELALRWGDIVGRLDTLVVGAVGGSGEEGFALASTWRGWPVDIGVRLFDASQDFREQPTELGDTFGLDEEERTGAELHARWDYLQRRWNVEAAGGVLHQRFENGFSGRVDQDIAFLTARQRARTVRGRMQLEQELRVRAFAGETDADRWSRLAAGLTAGIRFGSNGVALAWDEGSTRGADHAADRFVLGGVRSSIVPDSALSNRVLSPAFPVGTRSGDSFARQRAEVKTALFPMTLFFERNRLWDEQSARGEWTRAAGAEARFAFAPQPLLRMPALDFRLGAAQILDAPLEDERVWWLTLAWRP